MAGIKCERRIYNDSLNTHAHPHAQLILPMHGKLYIETNLKKLAVEDEHLFFLPPHCEHTFWARNTNEFLVLDISAEMLNQQDMKKMTGGREIGFDNSWQAIRHLLLNEADHEQTSSAVQHLFLYCYNYIIEGTMPASIKYLQEHFTEDIDIKTLARIEHYNLNYYSEWFRNNMNLSPVEYIQQLRIKKAKELLADTNLPILQIAHLSGYQYHSFFTRIFKELEGITPAEFRRKI